MKRKENGNKCKPRKEHQKEGNDNMMNQELRAGSPPCFQTLH
jgi:hypothetical protein